MILAPVPSCNCMSSVRNCVTTCSVVTQFLTEDMQLQLGTGANIMICSAYRVGKSAGAGGRPRAIVLKVGSAEQQQAILRQKKNVVQRLKEKKVWVDPSLTKSEQQRKKEIKECLHLRQQLRATLG